MSYAHLRKGSLVQVSHFFGGNPSKVRARAHHGVCLGSLGFVLSQGCSEIHVHFPHAEVSMYFHIDELKLLSSRK